MPSSSKSFLRHTLTYGGGTILLHAGSLLLLPLYTSYLSPAEFGVLDVLNRFGEVLCICLMVNGISKAAIAFYRQADSEQERKSTAATVTLFLAAILGGMGLMIVPMSGRAGTLLGLQEPSLLTFGVLVALLQATTAIPLALMQARIESGWFTAANLGIFLARVSLTIVTVVGLGWGVWGVLIASAATSALGGGALTLREVMIGSWRPDFRQMTEVARYALPFVPAGLFWFLVFYTDRFLLLRWCGEEELGLYALGARLAEAVAAFSIVPLQRVWSAKMFDAFEQPNAPTLIGCIFTRLMMVYLFAGIGLCVLKNEVIFVLGSGSYAGAGAAVELLVLAHFFSNASNLLDAAFYVCRETRWKAWLNLAAALVTIPLFFWLIPSYGALGAATALLIGSTFYAAITFIASQRVFRVHYEPLRLVGSLGLAIAVVCVARMLGTGSMAVLGKVFLLLAWPAALLLVGLVSSEEKHYLLQLLRTVIDHLRLPNIKNRRSLETEMCSSDHGEESFVR